MITYLQFMGSLHAMHACCIGPDSMQCSHVSVCNGALSVIILELGGLFIHEPIPILGPQFIFRSHVLSGLVFGVALEEIGEFMVFWPFVQIASSSRHV